MAYAKDTIAAKATAPGRGGIGIVRISGPDARALATSLLGHLPEPRYATYSRFLDGEGATLDTGIALFFQKPDSFTGEDVLELQGHGGPVVLDMLLERIVSLGARIAAPGEFSQRAFLNDKLDLAQAEAIADLIDSSTEAAARGAVRSLEGEFSRKVNSLVLQVTQLRVQVEAGIDFPTDEIDFISDEKVAAQLQEIKSLLANILDQAREGALLMEGAAVVLTGKPNVGKSSLMNRLTGRDTSIVTDVPGTTRDIVGESLQIDGIPLRLVDTAGIRDSSDAVEAEGIRRARAAQEEADLVIHLVDAREPLPEMPHENEESRTLDVMNVMNVLNKVDLVSDPSSLPDDMLKISAKTGEGIAELKNHLRRLLGVSDLAGGGFTARRRHLAALMRASEALAAGECALKEQQSGELLAEELRVCQQHLSEITGAFSADDLLGEIFSSFCIGK